jgi:hypothetical protein
MRTEPIAYEKYLVSQTNKILEMNPSMTSPIEIIASMLYEDCKKVNPLAFDIVGEVTETNWTFDTFTTAAEQVLSRVKI